MTTGLTFLKTHIENMNDPFGTYDVRAKLVLEKPFQNDNEKGQIHIGGRILNEQNRQISGIVIFSSDKSFMIEYENDRLIAHYRLDSGEEFEEWKEYDEIELKEVEISINETSRTTPLSTLQQLTKEPDFILKSPFAKIQDIVNSFSKEPVCDKVYRSDIDNGILVVPLSTNPQIEKEALKAIFRKNYIWDDLIFYDTHEVHLHFNDTKKQMWLNRNSA